MYNVIIVGAGVAGLVAAGTAAARGLSVLVVEKMEKPARKLRITGKGRCNITNTAPVAAFLEKVRSGREFVAQAFEMFDNQRVIEFMNSIGVKTIEERGGRVFPESGQAREVAERLVLWAENQGAKIQCNSPVNNIAFENNTYIITSGNVVYDTENVIVTTGGVSYPLTGSTGDGFRFAYDLGHEIQPLLPALVALRIDDSLQIENVALKNIKATLFVDNQRVDERFGDVEFNDRGLGGAAILQLSRSAVQAIADNRDVKIILDLKSALSHQQILNRISREISTATLQNLAALLRKLMPSAIIPQFCNYLQLPQKHPIAKITTPDIENIAHLLKEFNVPVVDYGSFNEAIITVGGVSLNNIDPSTMESKLCGGLYFAGEVLDIDADTGGYNIQLAISTAVLAANSIKKA